MFKKASLELCVTASTRVLVSICVCANHRARRGKRRRRVVVVHRVVKDSSKVAIKGEPVPVM